MDRISEEIVVKQFSREDFDTDKPYKYIYSFKDNKFEFNRLSNIINEQALKLKFKSFKSMLKSYVETEEQKLGRIINNATSFNDQPMELNSGDWQADEFGISKRNSNYGEDIACVHPIMPVERLVNIDTGIEKMKIAFRRGDSRNRKWRYEIYDKKTLASTQSILDLANCGIAVNADNAKHLIKYIHDMENLNFELIPEKKSVSRLGWIKDIGFSPYVEGIEFDGISNFRSKFESVHLEGSFDEWIELCQGIRKTDSVGRVALASSFASVLVSPLKKLNFIVHFWGGTEVGKTVALMLATSVWANPNPGGEDGYIQTFNGTPVAIELQSGFFNSLPNIMDEFQLVKDKKSFEQTVYMVCEGIGKIRGAKTGGLQNTPTWKNCTITSGETPISNDSSGGGAVNRIIEIECKDRIFEDAPKVADTVMANYGHAGKAFIAFLSSNDSKEKALQLYKKFYKELGENSTEKQTMAGALILTADALATEWIFCDDRALTVEDISKYLHSKASVDVCARAYDYLYEKVIANIKKFGSDEHDRWGSLSEERYVNIIKNDFNRICEEGGYNPKALWSWLIEKGICRTDKDRRDKVVKIDSRPVRCISIDIKDKYEDFDGFEPVSGQESLPFE